MKMYAALLLLLAFAVVLPGGSLLLPLAYAKYRRIIGHTRDSRGMAATVPER